MKLSTRYVLLLGIGVAMGLGVITLFFRLYDRDVTSLGRFLKSYKRFEQVIDEFSQPILEAGRDTTVSDQLADLFNVAASTPQDILPEEERMTWAREVKSTNNALLVHLRKSDELEAKVIEALTELKGNADARISSLIRNDRGLMSEAREIAYHSGMELEKLIAFKKAIAEKGMLADQFLRMVINDKGRLDGLIRATAQKGNQIDILELNKLFNTYQVLAQKRVEAYARFQALSPPETLARKD